jgi:hypothetical protein
MQLAFAMHEMLLNAKNIAYTQLFQLVNSLGSDKDALVAEVNRLQREVMSLTIRAETWE